MYLYQIDNKLIVSETKRPTKEEFAHKESKFFHQVAYNMALSEWKKNLIPVKEGEEEKFALYCFSKANVFDLRNSFDEAFKNGIEISDEAVRIEEEGCANKPCPHPSACVLGCIYKKKVAYLNSQPKKEESNEAIEQDKIFDEFFQEWHDASLDDCAGKNVKGYLMQKFKLTRK